MSALVLTQPDEHQRSFKIILHLFIQQTTRLPLPAEYYVKPLSNLCIVHAPVVHEDYSDLLCNKLVPIKTHTYGQVDPHNWARKLGIADKLVISHNPFLGRFTCHSF